MEQNEQCTCHACGYECNRKAMHGMLHYDKQYNTWWILNPHDDDERWGKKPMTGYELIDDSLLREYHE